MSLPFLPNKRIQSMLVVHKKSGQPIEVSGEEHPLSSAADDLIQAVHNKNVDATAKALEAAFQICDSMPHEEGDHI